jgi:hypothetical protein
MDSIANLMQNLLKIDPGMDFTDLVIECHKHDPVLMLNVSVQVLSDIFDSLSKHRYGSCISVKE